MPKVVDILKARWAEVLLLVGFQTGVLFLMEQIVVLAEEQAQSKRAIPEHIAFLLGMGTMAFIIIWQMLYLGFLRTAYEEGVTRWEPGQLLRIGRYYFWRVVRFQVLLLIAYLGLTMAAFSVVAAAKGVKTPDELPVWLVMAMAFAVSIVLIKPTAFAPAIMVGRDVMAFRSIGLLGEYRLLAAPAVPVLYLGAMIFSAGVSMADEAFMPKGMLHYVVMGVHHVVLSVAILAVHLTALRVIKASEPPAPTPTEIKGSDPFSGDSQP